MLVDPTEHFRRQVGPIEHTDLAEVPAEIRNIGWTLGNDCPYRCTHCYSMSARQKGMDFTPAIVDQLAGVGVETVNLGGNEPLFTNGPDPSATLLPRIIHGLADAGILVGLTTSGITLTHLHRDHKDAFDRLNDVDVSLDSPYPDEHNNNRGAKLYKHALGALRLCQDAAIPHSVIMCAMNWNFTPDRVSLRLAAAYLGTRVEVVIDRPHGSRHPVHGFRYDTNYGYLPGTRAPDGDELDAYYLGPPQPLTRANGTCVAVIHRLTDDDDKLVVPDGYHPTDTEILTAVAFQEIPGKHQLIRTSPETGTAHVASRNPAARRG